MASDEDIFDIDVYGDGEEEKADQATEASVRDDSVTIAASNGDTQIDVSQGEEPQSEPTREGAESYDANDLGSGLDQPAFSQPVSTEEPSSHIQYEIPKQPPQQQGVKRKEGPDDRPVDNGATAAIFVSDLHWWSTDDDVRGWVNQCQCEDELKDITFSEHKVNGKSKG